MFNNFVVKKILTLIVICSSIYSSAQKNNTFLWRIENPSAKTVSYLFGTIHVPQKKFMNLSDSVYKAMSAAKEFYTEIDFNNMYTEMADDNDGFYLSKLNYLDSVKKTSAWKKLVTNINKTYHSNIDPDSLDQFADFGNKLTANYLKPEPGITAMDIALASLAKKTGKKCGGLETYKFQVGMMYDIIDARLNDTTMLFDDDIIVAENLEKFYVTQEFDSLTKLINSINVNYRKIVFDNRNAGMAASIQKISSTKTAFFAVGCGHLLGPYGILNILRQKGFGVSPVFSAKKSDLNAISNMVGAVTASLKALPEGLLPKPVKQ